MPTDPVQELLRSVRADLRAALRRGDRVAASPLREMLAVIDNASAVDAPQGYDYTGTAPTEVPRRDVTIDEVVSILDGLVTERREAAATYRELGMPDHARQHVQAAAVLASYLPRGV